MAAAKTAPQQAGDIWTWTAIDADTKLIPSWLVGSRDAYTAQAFIGDLAMRLASRVQLTSDGHKPYLQAVEESFGADTAKPPTRGSALIASTRSCTISRVRSVHESPLRRRESCGPRCTRWMVT